MIIYKHKQYVGLINSQSYLSKHLLISLCKEQLCTEVISLRRFNKKNPKKQNRHRIWICQDFEWSTKMTTAEKNSLYDTKSYGLTVHHIFGPSTCNLVGKPHGHCNTIVPRTFHWNGSKESNVTSHITIKMSHNAANIKANKKSFDAL